MFLGTYNHSERHKVKLPSSGHLAIVIPKVQQKEMAMVSLQDLLWTKIR